MKLLLIDGNSLLFRAYYATAYAGVDNIMRTSNGFPTNAIYGLANLVTKILNDTKPDYALVAFDTSKPTFRHQEYKDYKAGRAITPDELKAQFIPARELLKEMGLFVFELEGYEADDIVGTTSKMFDNNFNIEIYSSDRDLLQLISDNTTVCLTKKGVSDIKKMTVESLKEELNISPSQITDLKGLMGDKSDNIPGVSKVGEMTAIKLLNEFGSVENIIENANNIKGKLGERIRSEKDIAIMSKKIATINTNVPVPYSVDDLKYNGPKATLSDFFKKYEMYSLDKRLKINTNTEENKEINVEEEFKFEIVSKIPTDFLINTLAFDLEIKGDNYHIDPLIGLGISNGIKSYFIKIEDLVNDINLINYLSSDFIKIGYDIKKIKVGLNRYNIKINNFKDDILLGTYLLESSLKEDPAILFNYYNKSLDYRNDVYKKIVDITKIYEYGAKISYLSFNVNELMKSKLVNENLDSLYNEIEIPLAFILAEMEINGIKIDQNRLEEKTLQLKNKIESLSEEIYSLAGFKFNINSPSQVAIVLFDKLNLPANKKRSTNADELEFLAQFNPICEKLLEYRQIFKLLNSYYIPLKSLILKDNRIHTIYNQALTTTGRLSSRDPNMQNISVRSEEGKEVRKLFISEENKLLISFDYSQIELRVLADMANVKNLKEAFINNVDIHADTAKKVFNLTDDQITKDIRRNAKTINFGIVYGMSDFELCKELNVSFGEAKEFMEKYFNTYPEIKEYFNNVIENAKSSGYTLTKFNRKRYIRELTSSIYLERERGKRMAMNAPIQGTAADIVKKSMIKVFNALNKNNIDAKMLLQVHDEIVLEINESDLDKVIEIVKTNMEDFDILSVPLLVSYHYGKDWME